MVEVRSLVVVGRKPSAQHSVGVPPQLVPVSSPHGYVSSTHLRFSVEDEHLLVEDVSRNGTLLERTGSDEEPQRLPARQLFPLLDGHKLILGDDVTITVALAGVARG
ncbi:FHA domain-containing protein [Nocardioides sp. YIM 123512]|uniref:FHA domain-containing protein n=1 Tax=Nocardioides flavescens TaxID=2691959 RepID=A0A6L7ETS0_9ACTN|nr:FHA domain-containing protein [Nocardioides flavescens]